MLFALKPLLRVLSASRSGPTGLSFDQGMRYIDNVGWVNAGMAVNLVGSFGGLLGNFGVLPPKVKFRLSAAYFSALGLQFMAALVSTALPAVEDFLANHLPAPAQPLCHALLVAAPRTGLAGFLRAYTAFMILCEIVLWLIFVMVAVGLVAVETTVYLATFAFLATTCAFVCRDLLHCYRMRESSSYRADQRARDMQFTMRQCFDLERRFGTLQTRLDNVLPKIGQAALERTFPLAALDFIDTISPLNLAQARLAYSALAEIALRGIVADLAPIYRGMATLLEEGYRAGHQPPLRHPLAHFLRTSSRTASALVAHLPFFPASHHADRRPTLSPRLFLPLLLTYPGFLAFEYLRWRRSHPSPDPDGSDVDPDAPHFEALRKISSVLHVNARSFGLDAQQSEQLVETYVAMVRVRRRAVAAEVVAFRNILDAVLDWKNRKNELEMRRFKQD